MSDVRSALQRALAALAPVLDVVHGRVEGEAPPAWCEARGWSAFLLGMGDAELASCEAEGFAACAPGLSGAPASLVALAAAVSEATALPMLAAPEAALPASWLRQVSTRKRRQLEALLGAVGPMAERASRIVDVGSGSGHFTRMASDRFAREAVGLEREADRVLMAAALAERSPAARFVTFDAAEVALAFEADDLAVGLHACGGLGDALISAAGEVACDVALVSCCPQKIAGEARAPLSRAAMSGGLALRREALGLANLTSQPEGVEVSLEATLEARRVRWALLSLLRSRGLPIATGEEMRGQNRRRSRLGFAEVAVRALELRGLAPPTDAELAAHDAASRRIFAAVRRLSLPRNMLARLVEVAIVLDRAAALEERGKTAVVATLCERAATPRNVALFASHDAARLPPVDR